MSVSVVRGSFLMSLSVCFVCSSTGYAQPARCVEAPACCAVGAPACKRKVNDTPTYSIAWHATPSLTMHLPRGISMNRVSAAGSVSSGYVERQSLPGFGS
jgi:hypothetical protein